MEPGQHVDGLGEGAGMNGVDATSLLCSTALSSISDVLLPIYAFAISIGEAPISSRL